MPPLTRHASGSCQVGSVLSYPDESPGEVGSIPSQTRQGTSESPHLRKGYESVSPHSHGGQITAPIPNPLISLRQI